MGFGREIFTSLQQYTVQGWQFTLELFTPEAIQACDAFTAALTGRRVGFWLPAPMEGMEITEVIDANHFTILAQGLAAAIANQPDIYLWFQRAGHASVAAKILGVSDQGNGTEQVTLQDAVVFLDARATTIRRLHYVRLAEDTERAQCIAEGWQTREVRVIELPHEYAAAETGEQPIYLYHFWLPAPVDAHWYFTSFAADVRSGGSTYLASPITHHTLRQGVQAQDEALEIEAGYNSSHPFTLFFPVPPGAMLWVQVLETSYADPEAATPVFTGLVRKPSEEDSRWKATCDSWAAVLRRKVPRLYISPRCPYQVYEPNTCRAVRAYYESFGEITAVDNDALPPAVTLQFWYATPRMQAADYFALGWVESGSGSDFELRSILGSTYLGGPPESYRLTLNLPLYHAQVGQNLQVVPGCDGAADTCKTKFAPQTGWSSNGNFINFGGFVAVPDTNLSLKALDANPSSPDKK